MIGNGIDFNQVEKWISAYNKYSQPKYKKQVLTLIVMACQPLVKNIAYGLARRSNDPIEDIIQVANIGLIKAVSKYKSEYNNLKVYISYTIIGEIKHYLRDKTKLIKIPREIIELSYRINKLNVEAIESDGEKYSEKLIAKQMGVSENKIQEVLDFERRKVISLDDIQYNNEGLPKSYQDSIGDEKDEINFKLNEYSMLLKDAIKQLPEKLQIIINGIYFENKLQIEVSKELKTSQSNVSRMQKRALTLLYKIISNEDKKEKE